MKISSRSAFLMGLIGSLSCISSCLFAADTDYATSLQRKTSLASTQIVGGQLAQASDWPWMTAYVVTFEGFATTLTVDNQSYSSDYFSEGPTGIASGRLINCGVGSTNCANAQDKICLIERGGGGEEGITFAQKAQSCESGGGVATIIYNNEAGDIMGTLGVGFTGTIPVVSVTRSNGLLLLDMEDKLAEVSISANSQLQQKASCGATFLGDKWVLTAAHCVDSPDAMFFKMNVGEYDLSNGAENASGIANIYIHPQYDAELIDFDVALVELVKSVDVPAVQIASKATTEQYATENGPAIVAGWGGRVGYAAGEGATSDFPTVLHQVELNLTTNTQCRQILADSLTQDSPDGTVYSPANVGVTNRMICATQPSSGKGSCQGDSGGPLIVQTVTGPQQVGIVSWGIGCAEAGYPGVFTRIAEFSEWLNTLQTGIAITQKLDFGVAPTGVTQTSTLQLINNSTFVVDLSFALSGSNAFSLGSNTCSNLVAGGSCALTVNLSPNQTGELMSTVTINTNNSAVLTSRSVLSAHVISTAPALSGVAGPVNNNVVWYSGGNKTWLANTIESGVQSGIVGNNQESILSAYIVGKGSLSFQWAVSSEENTDDPDDPYDALYLYVNNELQSYISGDVAFGDSKAVVVPISLNTDTSIITWVYSKNSATAEGDDKGYIRDVVFTPDQITPPPIPSVPTTKNNSSSGGSLSGLIMLSLLALVKLRKPQH
ncbi:trypsin-like serine protease [Paraglaciecola sp.]|uniref:trypsin-like serine protease n=1 Tax=Paraglaciecola sp. TaxID=1920173 RepID=UPI0030F49877